MLRKCFTQALVVWKGRNVKLDSKLFDDLIMKFASSDTECFIYDMIWIGQLEKRRRITDPKGSKE